VTPPPDEQRIAYRSHAVWFWPVFWPVAIALRWFLGWDAGGPMVLWIPGVALLEVNAVLTALRARRGLTLTAYGITWHKYEMRLTWSNVTAVEQSGSRGATRLVVRVGESGQALEDVPVPARLEVRANLWRFGAPIALRAGRLARPAAEVIEIADRLRREYAPPAGLKGFMTRDTPPAAERARRSARWWIRPASTGLGLVLFGTVIVNIAPSKLHARRLLGTRFTEPLQDFDVRRGRVPVTGTVRELARSCGSVKVYYSRPAPPVSA
jgi:hypothetical protein